MIEAKDVIQVCNHKRAQKNNEPHAIDIPVAIMNLPEDFICFTHTLQIPFHSQKQRHTHSTRPPWVIQ